MANTSRPSLKANSAVINEPLFFAASTTNIPLDNPVIILFLAGKFPGFGNVFSGYSDITAPFEL